MEKIRILVRKLTFKWSNGYERWNYQGFSKLIIEAQKLDSAIIVADKSTGSGIVSAC